MCCPAPYCRDPVHGADAGGMADYLAAELSVRMPAYRRNLAGRAPAAAASAQRAMMVEPLYGKAYLPRKFKVAVGLPGDNCVDLYSQDVGLMAICENFNVVGYNVLVGGGMGMTPGRKDTFPALAQPHGLDPARAGARRGAGDLAGLPRLRQPLGSPPRPAEIPAWPIGAWSGSRRRSRPRLGYALDPPQAEDVWDIDDHVGWHEQGDGRWFYGLHVAERADRRRDQSRLKSALREICRKHQPPIGLTPGQGILLLRHAAGRTGPASKTCCAGTASSSTTNCRTSAAGARPASALPTCSWPSPRASGCCPA